MEKLKPEDFSLGHEYGHMFHPVSGQPLTCDLCKKNLSPDNENVIVSPDEMQCAITCGFDISNLHVPASSDTGPYFRDIVENKHDIWFLCPACSSELTPYLKKKRGLIGRK